MFRPKGFTTAKTPAFGNCSVKACGILLGIRYKTALLLEYSFTLTVFSYGFIRYLIVYQLFFNWVKYVPSIVIFLTFLMFFLWSLIFSWYTSWEDLLKNLYLRGILHQFIRQHQKSTSLFLLLCGLVIPKVESRQSYVQFSENKFVYLL